MQRPKLNFRSYLLFGLLAVVATAWAAVTVHTWMLERSLKVVAEAKLVDLSTHFDKTYSQNNDFDLIPRVTASQDFLLFGPTHGKVHIFFRGKTENGRTHFGAFDYFFVHNGERWVETESGYCGDDESTGEARAAFALLERR